MKIAVPQATKQGYIECELGGVVDMSYPNSKTRRGRVQEGGTVSPTIMANNNELYVLEKAVDPQPIVITGMQKHQSIKTDGICNTLPAAMGMGGGYTPMILEEQIPFRVRKLTPKECWRLMGFDDGSFERAEQVNSNSQLYKQAGNSICVPVLEAIFKEML